MIAAISATMLAVLATVLAALLVTVLLRLSTAFSCFHLLSSPERELWHPEFGNPLRNIRLDGYNELSRLSYLLQAFIRD